MMSASVAFATLDDVALREAWAHEALSFTPWLADNLDRIADAIGVPLELEGREVQVGRYAADLLARNPIDDSLVLIENQLEPGDHGHLGQILTYLTGLRASTVVWVAQEFREEHLSAIKWLNQNTVDPYSFFAIKLRVVRIANSPLAPLFEVIERPNGWDRQLQEVVRERREPTELVARRRSFWELFWDRHPEIAVEPGGPGAASVWLRVGDTGLVLSLFISRDGVGIFVRGPRGQGGEAATQRLQEHESALETRLGRRLGDSRWPFNEKCAFDTKDAANWPQMADWLASRAKTYASALVDVVGTNPP